MIIGLAGSYPGVGQKTIVNRLRTKHGFVNSSISEPSEVIAESFFGYDSSKKDSVIPREIRYIGNRVNINMWVYYALDFARRRKRGLHIESMKISFLFYYNIIGIIEDIKKSGAEQYVGEENIVLSDIRSPQEARSIVNLGGKIFLVNREMKTDSLPHNFANDAGIFIGNTIENNGSIEDLNTIVDSIALR